MDKDEDLLTVLSRLQMDSVNWHECKEETQDAVDIFSRLYDPNLMAKGNNNISKFTRAYIQEQYKQTNAGERSSGTPDPNYGHWNGTNNK